METKIPDVTSVFALNTLKPSILDQPAMKIRNLELGKDSVQAALKSNANDGREHRRLITVTTESATLEAHSAVQPDAERATQTVAKASYALEEGHHQITSS